MTYTLRKNMSNPRDTYQGWKPRVAEFMGGHKPREMGNYGDLEVNPNEHGEGISHHVKGTPEDSEGMDQKDSVKRKKKAERELLPGLQHISLRPEKMNEMLERSPMMEGENKLLESALGVDMGAYGLSLAAGSRVGTVRSDTANVTYGHPSRGRIRASSDASFDDAWSIAKGKRKYKGRRYEEDEEDEQEERKSKARKKRHAKKAKRRKKAGGKLKGGGGRDTKSASNRHKGRAARQLNLHSRRQRFGPNVRSLPLRMMGSTRSDHIPLRLRDPVAWERKKAHQRHQRATGSQPHEHTHHRGSSGTGISSQSTRGTILGSGTKLPSTSIGSGTKLPSTSNFGTNMKDAHRKDVQRVEAGYGDPLGTEDYLRRSEDLLKAKGLSRIEILHLKRKIEALLKKLDKLTKASVDLGNEAKVGAQASPERSSDNDEKNHLKYEDQAAFRFEDPTIMEVISVVSKR